MKHLSCTLMLACALAAPGVSAQPTAPGAGADFPAEAKALDAEALKAALDGQKFVVAFASGTIFRFDFKSRSGWVFANAGSASDSGRWRTEDSRLCADYQQRFPPGCNEIRAVGNDLYFKRSSGEVAKMAPP